MLIQILSFIFLYLSPLCILCFQMDSRTLLDYALFHLTPTRTRCDLVVFNGGKSEKLASGLVEPFVAHLKYAKEQISKGGYSITLRPPTYDAFWFTKDTFQRFVRFVSTPEILERFLRTEQEISQIEKSIEVNEISNIKSADRDIEGSSIAIDGASKTTRNSYKSKNDGEGADGVASEGNSKFQLQRVLDTRKGLLLKEQAMVFARAKAAGFKIENMDDLTYFADAFGATRLREACVGFRDLYMLKCKDARWMDEVAAMEAFPPNMFSYVEASGITLASDNGGQNHNENNGSSNILDADNSTITDKGQLAAEIQMKMQWENQVPHYMYSFQNPMQQVPSCPAYILRGAHPVSPYYPQNVQWPTVDGPLNGFPWQSDKSKKKLKSKNDSGSEDDEQSESGSSCSLSDTDESRKLVKKHPQLVRKKKKSSKTVVIRNVNYITSKTRNGEMDGTSDGSSSDNTAELDEDVIKQEVVDAVTSLMRHQHSGSNKKKSGRSHRLSIQNGTGDHSDSGLVKDFTADISGGGQRNENWNALQNILMNREEPHPNKVQEKSAPDVDAPLAVGTSRDDNLFARDPIVGFVTEKVMVQHATSGASDIVTQRDGYNDSRIDVIGMTNVEERRSSMRARDSEDVQYVLSHRFEASGSSAWRITSDPSVDSSVIRNAIREDCIVVNQAGNLYIHEAEQIILDESNNFPSAKDSNLTEASKSASIDDSFMVQYHQSLDGHCDSVWRTDITIESDLALALPQETYSQKSSQPYQEPDDLCMMLTRDSVIESSGSWTLEIDYEGERRQTLVETNTEPTPIVESKSTKSKKVLKTSGKEAKSRLLQGTISRGLINSSRLPEKPSSANRVVNSKGKVKKEEETRKKMEDLVLERQKRIAERSASFASKKVLGRSKTASSMMPETRRLSSKSVSTNS